MKPLPQTLTGLIGAKDLREKLAERMGPAAHKAADKAHRTVLGFAELLVAVLALAIGAGMFFVVVVVLEKEPGMLTVLVAGACILFAFWMVTRGFAHLSGEGVDVAADSMTGWLGGVAKAVRKVMGRDDD